MLYGDFSYFAQQFHPFCALISAILQGKMGDVSCRGRTVHASTPPNHAEICTWLCPIWADARAVRPYNTFPNCTYNRPFAPTMPNRIAPITSWKHVGTHGSCVRSACSMHDCTSIHASAQHVLHIIALHFAHVSVSIWTICQTQFKTMAHKHAQNSRIRKLKTFGRKYGNLMKGFVK